MSDRDPRGEPRTLERLLMIGAVGLITCLAFETLATTNAMPTIVATLGSDRWYSLTVGVVLAGQILSTVVTGWVSDRYGVRLPLLTGVSGFALGATIAGLAPNLALFIIGRAVQGLGSGMVIVPLMVLIGAIVDPKRRPTFFAAFSFAWVIPSMIGPTVSGYIVDHWHWRAIFLIIVPLALVTFIPLTPILSTAPRTERDASHLKKPAWLAAILTGIALVAWQSAAGATSIIIMLGMVAGGALILILCLPRLFPAGTLRASRGVPAMVATRLSAMGSMIGIEMFIPLTLQRIHLWTPTASGWALVIGSVTWTLGSWVQSRITGSQRRIHLPRIGTLMVCVGTVITALLIVPTVSTAVALTGWAIVGFGMGLALTTTSDLVLAITPQERHGTVSAALQVSDAAGPALAMGMIAVATAGWTHATPSGSPALHLIPAFAVAILLAVMAFVAFERNRGLRIE